MIIDTKKQLDKQKAISYFEALINKECVFELTEKKPKRSYKQNSYLHLLLGLFGLELGYTIEESKELYKRLNKNIYEYEKNGLTFYRSSADLDTKEMTDSIDKFRTWSAQNGGIYLPSPDDIEQLNEVDLLIKQNSKYL